MFFKNELNAVLSAELLAKIVNRTYAIYAEDGRFKVVSLTQPTGLELEIIKP